MLRRFKCVSSVCVCACVCVFLHVARHLIDRKVEQISAQVAAGKPVEGMYLTHLLSCDKLTLPEVYISITELLLGGVDTVRGGGGGGGARGCGRWAGAGVGGGWWTGGGRWGIKTSFGGDEALGEVIVWRLFAT